MVAFGAIAMRNEQGGARHPVTPDGRYFVVRGR